MTSFKRRRPSLPVTLLVATAVLLGIAAGPGSAHATPSPSPSPGELGDEESGNPLLRDVIEATSRGYVEAKTAVEASRKRQLQLALELQKVETKIKELEPEIAAVASNAYRTGRIGPMTMLLNSASPENFLARAEGLEALTMHDDRKIRELNEALDQADRAKKAIDAAVTEEQQQLTVMAKQKTEAEKALRLAGGSSTGGFVNANSPVAAQAPRNRDGSWPPQSCNQNDPTTSGCLTARTLHALKESQKAGFNRYVACYRPGDRWEHPKGRACDFSVQQRGFGGHAQGDNRLYGNNLAAFLVRNADRLGILYVIWYRQVWQPATGWSSYSGAGGDPSSDHTNHVHLSML